MTSRQVEISVCSKCGRRWFGGLACHCNNCHQTFRNCEDFDAHFETPDYDSDDPNPICIPTPFLTQAGFTKIRMDIWIK